MVGVDRLQRLNSRSAFEQQWCAPIPAESFLQHQLHNLCELQLSWRDQRVGRIHGGHRWCLRKYRHRRVDVFGHVFRQRRDRRNGDSGTEHVCAHGARARLDVGAAPLGYARTLIRPSAAMSAWIFMSAAFTSSSVSVRSAERNTREKARLFLPSGRPLP